MHKIIVLPTYYINWKILAINDKFSFISIIFILYSLTTRFLHNITLYYNKNKEK